jgi:hypothetical protein
MSDQSLIQAEPQEMWAIVELMGHGQTAGRVSKPTEWGGLLRVDIPTKEGYRTEFYGEKAIYSVRFVSEEIARAMAPGELNDIVAYDTPIVTREEHQSKMAQVRERQYELLKEVEVLRRRLTQVDALPAGDEWEEDDDYNSVDF